MEKIVPVSHSSDELSLDYCDEYGTATLDAVTFHESVSGEKSPEGSSSPKPAEEKMSMDENPSQAESESMTQPGQSLVIGAPIRAPEPKSAVPDDSAPKTSEPEIQAQKTPEIAAQERQKTDSGNQNQTVSFSGHFDVPRPITAHWSTDESDVYKVRQSGPICPEERNKHFKYAAEKGMRIKINGSFPNDTPTHKRIRLLEAELLHEIAEAWPSIERQNESSGNLWREINMAATRLYGSKSPFRKPAEHLSASLLPKFRKRVFENNAVGVSTNVANSTVGDGQDLTVIDLTKAAKPAPPRIQTVQEAQMELLNAQTRKVYPWTREDHAFFFHSAPKRPVPMNTPAPHNDGPNWPLPTGPLMSPPRKQPLVPRRRRR